MYQKKYIPWFYIYTICRDHEFSSISIKTRWFFKIIYNQYTKSTRSLKCHQPIVLTSKIGPTFKKDGKKIVSWINNNQEEIIKKIEKTGDITISEIPNISFDKKDGLLKQGFIEIQKEIKVKGKKDSDILSFNDFYLEIKNK